LNNVSKSNKNMQNHKKMCAKVQNKNMQNHKKMCAKVQKENRFS